MIELELHRLHAHPENANRIPKQRRETLRAHLQRSGRCPPLIVRPHPHLPNQYELLDGHHRAELLRELGHERAPCAVWDVDDADARVLLLTLNRLTGADDPQARGALVRALEKDRSLDELVKLLPDDRERLERLTRLADPAPPPPNVTQHDLDELPRAVTFFLAPHEHRVLQRRLRMVGGDRSRALVQLLDLTE